MSNVTFVGTYAIPEGKFDEWAAAIKDMTDFVGANAARLVSFDTYLNDARTEGTTIYVHPDSLSLEEHLALAAQRISAGTELVRTLRVELYGDPSEFVIQRLRQLSEESQFPLVVKRHFYGVQRERVGVGPGSTPGSG